MGDETVMVYLVSYVFTKEGIINGSGRLEWKCQSEPCFDDVVKLEKYLNEKNDFTSCCVMNICRLADTP